MSRYDREKTEQHKDAVDKHNEETMDELRLRAKEECHYLKKIPAGRVGGDEGYYWCRLSDHPCEMEYNNFGECEEHADFVAELKKKRRLGKVNGVYSNTN